MLTYSIVTKSCVLAGMGETMKIGIYLAAIAAIFVNIGADDAQAAVIDLETVDTTHAPLGGLIADGDYVTQGGYYFRGLDLNRTSGSLVGALINGADPGTCLSDQCPAGNATKYIAALNDGIIEFGKVDGSNTSLLSFDAAFLASPDATPMNVPGLLGIQTNFADGSFSSTYYNFGAIGAGGTTAFHTYQGASAPAAISYFAYAFRCDATGACSAFQTNEGQFALDNLRFADASVGTVPESGTWAMMLVGFGMVGFAVRRRSIKPLVSFS